MGRPVALMAVYMSFAASQGVITVQLKCQSQKSSFMTDTFHLANSAASAIAVLAQQWQWK
jgi:hypothetical protein